MPLRNVAEYLERSAARVPDKTAFSDAAGAVSYRQMLHDAQALGTVLAGLPGCRNAPVAVMIGRTAASVTAMQGVLQSGCYYVPIDEQMPEARMRSILGQVHARAIVHTAANEPQARALADCAPLVSLEEASQHTPDEALLRAKREGRSRACIYVEGKMVLKSNYYPRSQLERLAKLSGALGRTEASLLREALDDLVEKYRGEL